MDKYIICYTAIKGNKVACEEKKICFIRKFRRQAFGKKNKTGYCFAISPLREYKEEFYLLLPADNRSTTMIPPINLSL
jgi:hypothetical protein